MEYPGWKQKQFLQESWKILTKNTNLSRFWQKIHFLQEPDRKKISCRNLFFFQILTRNTSNQEQTFSVKKFTKNDQHGHRRVSCSFSLLERDKHKHNHRWKFRFLDEWRFRSKRTQKLQLLSFNTVNHSRVLQFFLQLLIGALKKINETDKTRS